MDVEYLKSVMLSAFKSKELAPTSSLFPVLSRLLQFGPEEVAMINDPSPQKLTKRPSRSLISRFSSMQPLD